MATALKAPRPYKTAWCVPLHVPASARVLVLKALHAPRPYKTTWCMPLHVRASAQVLVVKALKAQQSMDSPTGDHPLKRARKTSPASSLCAGSAGMARGDGAAAAMPRGSRKDGVVAASGATEEEQALAALRAYVRDGPSPAEKQAAQGARAVAAFASRSVQVRTICTCRFFRCMQQVRAGAEVFKAGACEYDSHSSSQHTLYHGICLGQNSGLMTADLSGVPMAFTGLCLVASLDHRPLWFARSAAAACECQGPVCVGSGGHNI